MELCWVLGKALEVLRRYPLCDRCLGRLFAQLGKGFDNAERGRAIKTCLAMEIHQALSAGTVSVDDVKDVAKSCDEVRRVLETLGISAEAGAGNCYICGNRLEHLIEWGVEAVKEKLCELGVDRFLVGVVPPSDIVEKEKEVARATGLTTWESVRSELKRVIGKAVRDRYGFKPDFENPCVTIILDMNTMSVRVEVPSLLILGTYWKLGRRISQVPWIEKDGSRRYPLAIEDALQAAAEVARGDKAVFHGGGREDVDVRMLGSGRPFVLEIHRALDHSVDLRIVEEKINSFSPWLGFELEMSVRREVVANVKGSRGYKIYRALVLTERSVSEEDLSMLESFFRGRVVEQWTPKRVLRRKREALRRRKVISVRAMRLDSNLFEALIKAEGGLYIKELISGDDGRTTPSFSEVLNTKAVCLELDVVYVQKQI
ncbi:MAG: tRNA pseudouridine(54/55) synthase Pus10 [Crenarchaeota archaeon]|nr:tRNA pseudouridine(54/55) synthase Pus10 [Thermoproteota archaeon]